jgi:xanthine dehydrogenase accessory factor
MLPAPLVHVFGASPVARALVRLGDALGYQAAAGTDPDAALPADLDAVVVASHGHDEAPVLTAALRARVPYVALVASRRRGAAVLAALGLPAELTARVHTPAGLDVGARTASEIALSVYAEMVAERRPAVPGQRPSGPVFAEAVDPVCGMTVAVTTDTPSTAGVYFCGSHCMRTYADDPARFGS